MTEVRDHSAQLTASYAWAAAGARGQQPRLVVFWADHVVTRPLEPGAVVRVGRSSEASLRVDHPSVSRLHAEVRCGDRISVTDLGSSNGTRVAGRVLGAGESHDIEPGQVASLGVASLLVQPSSVEFRAPIAGQALPSPWPDQGPMAEIAKLLRLIAAGNVSVLLTGETGTGKEVAAEFVHQASRRAGGPLVRINCAALPEALLESELFGHERGAFTGADRAKAGLAEAADGGTLFLDEVGEIPLPLQAKLLRFLDTGAVQRLGALAPKAVDVRLVAATNRDLSQEVAHGRFRQDLFFRLACMPVELPPLRQRPDEIETLARRFLADLARTHHAPDPGLLPQSVQALRSHDFPGNVRELRNVIDRAWLLASGQVIGPDHLMLPRASRAHVPAADLRSAVKHAERQRLIEALEETGGNQTHAAKLLGIGRRTLIDKLSEHGLTKR